MISTGKRCFDSLESFLNSNLCFWPNNVDIPNEKNYQIQNGLLIWISIKNTLDIGKNNTVVTC